MRLWPRGAGERAGSAGAALPSTTRLAAVIVRSLLVLAVGGLLALSATLAVIQRQIGPADLISAEPVSVTVLDRDDRLLRAYVTEDGRWRLPLEVADVDPRYLAMLLAFEDRRFYAHTGVDLLAFVRSGINVARKGRITSGGSTITMQVARLLDGRHERTGMGKLRQMARALELEQKLSKEQILRLYLRLAPFGGNVEGVRAASLAYLGKEPRRLSAGEAALLVALPQSPAARRPDRFPEAARRARDRVLETAVATGVISRAEATRARAEPVHKVRVEFPRHAAHLADDEIAREPSRRVHRTTLDRDLQVQLETLAAEGVRALGPRISAAIVVVDNVTGEVLAHVGSSGYLDAERFGSIDMTTAVRSPGSTLKPFIYGLAFELGMAHPETMIEDRATRFSGYNPKNFDEDFRGTVTIREALAHSLNIPAVKVLSNVGPQRLAGRLKRAGAPLVLPGHTEPTLAIALGGVGTRLVDLAGSYASLARGGDLVRLRHSRDDLSWRTGCAPTRPEGREQAIWDALCAPPGKEVAAPVRGRPSAPPRLMSPVAAWYVGDVLRSAPPPPGVRGGGIAYKTGTSYGFRDAWSVGFDGRHTIAVWVGRPDGVATSGLTGRTAAAPILFDAFRRIGERRAPLTAPPKGALQLATGRLPPPLRRWREAGEEVQTSAAREPAVQIAFPPDKSEIEIEGGDGPPLVLKAEGGALPLVWLVDGKPIAGLPGEREVAWRPDGEGFARLSVVDAHGRVDRVTVRLRR